MDHLLVHLLGNCHVHSFALNNISLGSSNSTLTIISTFYTLHNFSSILCFPLLPTLSLCLSLSSSHQPWQRDPSESSRSSLFSYSILFVNSLFFYLFIYYIYIWFVFNFCLSDEKTVEKEEKRKFYFWVFCVSLFYIWIFPLVAVVRLSNKNCFPYYYNAKSEKNKIK